jgi:hypothetical protein
MRVHQGDRRRADCRCAGDGDGRGAGPTPRAGSPEARETRLEGHDHSVEGERPGRGFHYEGHGAHPCWTTLRRRRLSQQGPDLQGEVRPGET